MRKASDLVGQAFGEWVVVKRGRPRPNKHLYWLCRCSCGKEKLECNYAKRDKSYDAFINHIRRVYEYHVRDA